MPDVSAVETELEDCRSKLQLLTLLGSTVMYIFDCDERRPSWVSTDIRRLLGYEPEEILAMGAAATTHFIHPEDLPAVLANQERWATSDEGAILEVEYRLRRRDGSWCWFGSRDVVLSRHPDGRPAQVLGIAQDVSERRLLAEQTLRLAKLEALGRLAGGIAHDFNNLLTVVLGSVALARASLDQGADPSPHIEEIQRVADQAATISRQLLGFARMQAARVEVLDPNHVVGELASTIRRILDPYPLRLELGEVWPIRMDRAQLAQVFLNLVMNARDAGGGLTIRTSRTGLGAQARVRLELVDDGHGMSADVLERAFDPFYSTKARSGGAGLGLATVFGIISQHGGLVTAHSEPHRGTRIVIELPATDEVRRKSAETLMVQISASIIVVEDEPMVAELTRRILAHAGHRVQVACDGQAALEAIRGLDPPIDLVVSDIVMPRLGGIELARILANERPGLPVLLVSGCPEDTRSGSDDILMTTPFLPKPFKASELVGAVGALLARSGPRA